MRLLFFGTKDLQCYNVGVCNVGIRQPDVNIKSVNSAIPFCVRYFGLRKYLYSAEAKKLYQNRGWIA